jgi:hypothetical protein
LAYDRTLVQIRERQFLDVLDLAMVVVRERPLTLGITALVGIAPFAALNAWLMRLPDLPFILFVGLVALEIPWATAPLTVVLGGLMFDETPSPGRVARTLGRSFIPMIMYQLLVPAALMPMLFTYLLVPSRLAFVNEVILLERSKWRSVVHRSAQLCEQRGGELFGQWLGKIVLGGLFVLAFWAGTGAIAQLLFTTELTWDPTWADMFDARLHAGLWLAIAFFGVARFFCYIDQRIRLEGWEVALRLRVAGQALEEARRW